MEIQQHIEVNLLKDKKKKPYKLSYDLTGQTFGRLTALSKSINRTSGNAAKWNCICICGNYKEIAAAKLKDGHTKSCGCLISEASRNNVFKHGFSKGKDRIPEYQIWSAMKNRCYKKNKKEVVNRSYYNKGIKVCDRWLNSFENFIEDMGRRPTPNHSIDRINGDGDYEPTNCRWATSKEQMRNVSNNLWLEINGERKILTDWAIFFNITSSMLYNHLKRNGFEKSYLYYTKKMKKCN